MVLAVLPTRFLKLLLGPIGCLTRWLAPAYKCLSESSTLLGSAGRGPTFVFSV